MVPDCVSGPASGQHARRKKERKKVVMNLDVSPYADLKSHKCLMQFGTNSDLAWELKTLVLIVNNKCDPMVKLLVANVELGIFVA